MNPGRDSPFLPALRSLAHQHPARPAVPPQCPPRCAPVLPVTDQCRPRLPPCPLSHPSPPIPAALSSAPGGSRRCLGGTRGGQQEGGGDSGGQRHRPPRTPAPLPGPGPPIGPSTGVPPSHLTARAKTPNPILPPGWGPYPGLSLRSLGWTSPVPAPPGEPRLSTEAEGGQDGGTHLDKGPSASQD